MFTPQGDFDYLYLARRQARGPEPARGPSQPDRAFRPSNRAPGIDAERARAGLGMLRPKRRPKTAAKPRRSRFHA